jgi:hypothetical protein
MKRSVHSKILLIWVDLEWEDMASVRWDWPLPTVMERGGSVVEVPNEVSSTNSPAQILDFIFGAMVAPKCRVIGRKVGRSLASGFEKD